MSSHGYGSVRESPDEDPAEKALRKAGCLELHYAVQVLDDFVPSFIGVYRRAQGLAEVSRRGREI
ncbi:unnamed protein product [Notodromas monacha]|uniref:Uncharacterized protein n=1 Tax=Notodromas monacha TaxID=399045 RepID=A0A7R9GCN6_9CRUS|nr:unnamed protein product [Notodromas monacha]CAG0917841.1 unnamed protein product [Notodromas monacha]